MIVIIKPTTACNGSCVYCSTDSSLDGKPFMPKENLKSLFEAFIGWLNDDESRSLDFIWHGGEPMLCGLDYYQTVIAEQNQVYRSDMPRIRNLMQSNLTLMTNDWIPCLKTLLDNLVIGSSFDPVDGIRGLSRGGNLPQIWVDAVDLLHAHGLSTGVMYIVHKKSLSIPQDLYRFFNSLKGVKKVRFNPMYRAGRGFSPQAEPLQINADEYGQFLVDLCNIWFEDGMTSDIAPLVEWHAAWFGNPFRLCCDSLGFCHETHLGIGPDGSVYGCGRALESKISPYGNIFEDDLKQILKHPQRLRMASRSEALQAGPCLDCDYWNFCHGGCPIDGWIYHGDLFRETYFCAARKALFSHFENLLGPPRWDRYHSTLAHMEMPRSYIPQLTEDGMNMRNVKVLGLENDAAISAGEIQKAFTRERPLEGKPKKIY